MKPSKKVGKRSKFQDWVYKTISCCNGCSNDCVYCFAKGDAINKKRISLQDWRHEIIRQKDVDKDYTLFDEPIMFPGTHDITLSNLDSCKIVLNKLLEAGNRILLVSKPLCNIITEVCDDLKEYKNQIIFRFTIGAKDDKILSFWEPNAPNYAERKASLEYAFMSGFRTSVSIEPMLNSNNIEALVDDLSPFFNHSIWIGTMNHPWYFDIDESDVKTDAGIKRVKRNIAYYGNRTANKIKIEREKILAGQSPEKLVQIYKQLDTKRIQSNGNRLIYWKWHIKNALGLPQPDKSEQWPVDHLL
ncbi:radical SAM protein [uncultured Desulfosarcina sp.]|uniref:radical SAM protein n=1 Tax=uncultured Desulfosarcina sp. TaxID=218289 RepID=UPI0029C89F03|nr:radical SAM protein [uncultured Desulfosarcina sp.]